MLYALRDVHVHVCDIMNYCQTLIQLIDNNIYSTIVSITVNIMSSHIHVQYHITT